MGTKVGETVPDAVLSLVEDVESKRLLKEPLAVGEQRVFGSPAPPGAAHERLLALVDLEPASQRYVTLGVPRARRGLARLGGEPLPMRLVRRLPGVDVRIVAARRRTGGVG